MKKINVLFLTVAIISVMSCSTPNLEDKAKERVRPLTEIIVNDPASLIIQDLQVKVSNDSLCVIQYIAKSKGIFGGYLSDRMEYVYIIKRNKDNNQLLEHYEYAKPIGGTEGNSVTDVSMWEEAEEKIYEKEHPDAILKKTFTQDDRDNFVYRNAYLLSTLFGKKVE